MVYLTTPFDDPGVLDTVARVGEVCINFITQINYAVQLECSAMQCITYD